jgi:NAD(P)-dependent dehydrogenase (short-subunit alcohol dehydrogenase family)
MSPQLEGKAALVAGGTVYVSGRSTSGKRSEYDRPETIEETAALVDEAGGRGIPVRVDHLEPDQVRALVERIDEEQGRLDVLVNDVWGGERLIEWNVPVWEHPLQKGFRMLRLAIDTHIITSHFALPLLIRNDGGLLVEMTDGTAEYNEKNYRNSLFYDLAKTSVIRLAWAQAKELAPHRCTAVALTPGWLRSEMMLDHFGVDESNWREATWDGRWPTSPPTPRWRGSTGNPSPAAGSRRSTASRTSTALGPTPGATSPRCRTRVGRPTLPGTANDAGSQSRFPAPDGNGRILQECPGRRGP